MSWWQLLSSAQSDFLSLHYVVIPFIFTKISPLPSLEGSHQRTQIGKRPMYFQDGGDKMVHMETEAQYLGDRAVPCDYFLVV